VPAKASTTADAPALRDHHIIGDNQPVGPSAHCSAVASSENASHASR